MLFDQVIGQLLASLHCLFFAVI